MPLWFLALIAMPAVSAAETPAGGTLDLATAIREAKDYSPELKRAQAAEREASWKLLESASGYIPHASVDMTHFFARDFTLLPISFGGQPLTFPGVYPVDTLTLNFSWTVFDSLQTVFAYRAATHGHEAARLELERQELKVEDDVKLRYYQALAAKALADVAEQNVRTLNDHLDKAKAQLSGGTATRFDILRVQVQLEEAVPERSSADDNVVLARLALAKAMGLERDDREVVGSLPVPDARALPADLSLSVENRADLAALRERAAAADSAHSASISSWLPKVSLIAQWQGYNNTWTDAQGSTLDAPWRTADNFGVALSWNLFDGGASIARQHEAAYAREQAEAASTAAALSAPQDFELWKRRYLYNASLYVARGRAIEAAEESVRLARLSYSAGTRTSTDVLDAELDLFRARAGLVRAQMDAAEALINLELAVGRKL